jgi:hypothetical protein
MKILSSQQVDKLIEIEEHIHYKESPPDDISPFVIIERASPVLISAPHGCRTYRARNGETWHDEDEYTAGMAMLLSELCSVSVIATIWQTGDSDPNDTKENDEQTKRSSPYKKAMRELCGRGISWVIDLHGASLKSEPMASTQLVDLGSGKEGRSFPGEQLRMLRIIIENNLGVGATDRKGKTGWPASVEGRSITAFVHEKLKKNAVQIEMKPAVRVAYRRVDATMFDKPISDGGGPYTAQACQVLGMMQSLVDFIEYLKVVEE